MRKPVIDNVEIIEPPIGELSKQRSSFRKTCLTGCGCVIFLVAGLLGGLRLYVGSGPTTVKNLPAEFPKSIPVYEKDSISKMTYISGRYKDRSMNIAAFFPKVILSPLLLQMGNSDSTSTSFIAANRNFWKLLTAPVGDSRDTIQIEWKSMDADPGFMVSYYRKELQKEHYRLGDVTQDKNTLQFAFENDENISGTLYTESDSENHAGTDYASLTVNIPSDYNNSNTK
jgi:hypothetical protein